MDREEFVNMMEKSEDWMEYTNSLKKEETGYMKSFEYWVEDQKGKKFAIHADVYDMGNLGPASFNVALQFEVQFNGLSDEKNTFNVELLFGKDQTEEEVVEFFEEMWEKMDCEYYERKLK